MFKRASIAVGLFLLAGGTAQAAATTCDSAAAKRAWAKCSACHSADPGGRSPLGPNLSGVIGRRAAAVPGFRYSPAFQRYRGVWSRQTFEAFLASPQTVVPGNRMAFSGINSAPERAALSCALAKGKP